MPKINTDAAMLWSMAASITLSLLLMRHLQAEGLHSCASRNCRRLGAFWWR